MNLDKRFSFILTLLFLISSGLHCQELKPFHVDSTGMLYVNPETPVFLYMSTSPDGKNAVKLQSEDPEGNPLRWNGHGFNHLTHLNLFLGRKIRFDIFVDGKPPQTSATFDAKSSIQKNNVVYILGTCIIELSAIDANSGVSSIYYSINGSEFKQYNSSLTFEREGEFNLQFYAIDNVGNKEDAGERKLIVDFTPPATELEFDGPKYENVVSAQTKFILISSDNIEVNETLFILDDKEETRYALPISLKNLNEGDHALNYYSTDILGNAEAKKTYSFFVDRTPPMVFEEIVGNTYMVAGREFSSGRSQLRIVAVDNKAGVKEIYYSVNNTEFKLYEKPIYLSEISGAISIKSYAVDNVNNKGTSDAQGQQFSMPEVDISGPTITHKFIGNRITIRDTIWINASTKVEITATDNGSGLNRVEYKLNNGASQPYSEPFTVEQSGRHNANLSAWDNVDNLNINSFFFGVDDKAPELFQNFSIKPYGYITEDGQRIPVYESNVILYLGATDDISGVEKIMVSTNGSKERIYAEPLSGFKPNQTHTLTLRVKDRLGNEASETVKFRVQ